jgi:ribosomal protein S7
MTDQAAPSPDDKTSRSDMQLIERAIKNGWPISPLVRQAIMAKMTNVAVAGESERSQIAAARVLIAADRNNIQRESLQMKEEQSKNPAEVHHVHEHYVSVEQRRNRVTLLAQRLGISLPPGADALLAEGGCPEADAGLPDESGVGGVAADRIHGTGLESPGTDSPVQADLDRGLCGGTLGSGVVGADQESAD